MASTGAGRRTFWFVAPGVAGVMLALAAVRAWLPPGSALVRLEAGFRCPFLAATGMRCPLCGLTTSMALALQGRWGDALAAHPLGPAVVALSLGAVGYGVWRRGRGAGRGATEGE